MTPWIDTSKIRVGPISPEQRRAIDAHLALRLAQHRIAAGRSCARASVARLCLGR
jgi:hypothetical protein